MHLSTLYRLICYDQDKKVCYYRWYIAFGYPNVALSNLRKVRDVTDFEIKEFADEEWREIANEDKERLDLKRCRQCLCLHSDGSMIMCGKCLKHPYLSRRKDPIKEMETHLL
jgi:hypothetical protein